MQTEQTDFSITQTNFLNVLEHNPELAFNFDTFDLEKMMSYCAYQVLTNPNFPQDVLSHIIEHSTNTATLTRYCHNGSKIDL